MVLFRAGRDRYETVMALKILDLFSGIGGFSYAAERLVGGYETVGFCEIDPFCQKVLKKHWPNVPVHDDVRKLANEADRFRGLVDVVCGGYPCQPFSLAGVRKGQEDDRHLWPEMLRIIQAAKPRFVIGENVAGHISMGLDHVLSDLEAENYTARAFVIPACAKDAKHRRDRVWVVGYTEHYGSSATKVRRSDAKDEGRPQKGQKQAEQSQGANRPTSDAVLENTSSGKRQSRSEKQEALREVSKDRREHDYSGGSGETYTADVAHTDCIGGENKQEHQTNWQKQQPDGGSDGATQDVGNANGAHPQRGRLPIGIHPQHTDTDCGGDRGRGQATQLWEPEPRVGRVANGIPKRVDRLKSLGNSIVPQVAAEIFIAIKAMAGDDD